MTLRSDIEQLFEQARAHVAAASTPRGVMSRDSDPDIRFVAINANNEAVAQALLKIADRIDALENGPVA